MQRAKAGAAILFLIASAIIFSVLMEGVFEARDRTEASGSSETLSD